MRVIKNTLKKQVKVVAEDEVETMANMTVQDALKPADTEEDQATREFKQKTLDDMTDAEVLNFAFINQPKNIELTDRQNLMKRAADISRNQLNQGSLEHEKFVGNVAAYANNFSKAGKHL